MTIISGTPDRTIGTTTSSAQLAQPAPRVGGYRINQGSYGIMFNFTVKPSAWHRFWCRMCLGWVWEDR